MREAAEAAHDLAVVLRAARAGLTQAFGERDAAVLVGQIFRMAERQTEKKPQRLRDRAIVTDGDGGVGRPRASASVAYIREVPRKALRGNWSSRITRASALSAKPAQPASSPRAAAS